MFEIHISKNILFKLSIPTALHVNMEFSGMEQYYDGESCVTQLAAPMITHPQMCAAEILNTVKPAYNGTARDRISPALSQAGAV
jgi:hypothetical protein